MARMVFSISSSSVQPRVSAPSRITSLEHPAANFLSLNFFLRLETSISITLREGRILAAAPTRPVYYYKVKLDLPYKEYEWCETKYKVDSKTVLFDNFANVVEGDSESEDIEVKEKVEEFNCPKSLEEAKARIEYNDVLRGLLEVAVDIKTANVLLNLSDDQTYALTTEQMLALGW